MKKIIVLLAVFTFIIGGDAKAQIAESYNANGEELVTYTDGDKATKHHAKRKKKHVQKARKKAQRKKIRAMKKVAKADGVVTQEEKKVIAVEKRKMKRKSARRHKLKAEGVRDDRRS